MSEPGCYKPKKERVMWVSEKCAKCPHSRTCENYGFPGFNLIRPE